MNPGRIRGFLLRHPKPHSVRLTTTDGEVQNLSLGRGFAKCAESIAAVGADLIECLDSDGNLIRAVRVSSAEAQRSDAAAIPSGLEQDPQALLLTHFANLLHRAYEHSTEIAFVKMVDVFERMGDRAEQIEARLERQEAINRRMAQDQIDEAMERVEEEKEKAGEGDFVQNMASAFLSGSLQPKTTAAASNGAKPTNGAKGS